LSGSLPGWTGKGASLYLSRSTSFSSRYDKLRRIQTEFSTHWETNKEIPLKSFECCYDRYAFELNKITTVETCRSGEYEGLARHIDLLSALHYQLKVLIMLLL